MNASAFDAELRQACEVARAAGMVLHRRFGTQLKVGTKHSEADLVTEADLESEALITERLRAAFPRDGVLAEEAGASSQGERTWIVDPLDGTSNFAHGVPQFAVSIALYQGTEARVGVVFDPIRDELFSAARDTPAVLESRGFRTELSVSDNPQLGRALVSTGFVRRKGSDWRNLEHFTRLAPKLRGVRRLGAAALDLAYVAAGRLDAHWEYELSPWDSAAGALLVSRAGGRVTTLSGQPWTPWSEHLLASSAALSPALSAELQS